MFAVTLAFSFIASPTDAGIESRTWIGSVYDWGRDEYYGAYVYGYAEDSTATVWIRVENDYQDGGGIARPINVSEIIVGFDWNINYTNTLTPTVNMQTGEIRHFTVTFTVPNTSAASNKYLHGYTIYVKHINATGGPVETMTTKTIFTSSPDFAVYSKAQMEARSKARLYSQLIEPIGGFNSTAAKISWSKSVNESNIARTFYIQGDFAKANEHYENALSLKNQAFGTEQAITGGIQDAELALIQAHTKSIEAQGNYLNGLSNMWVLIGVAAVLFAIGYLIRGLGSLRRLPPAAT